MPGKIVSNTYNQIMGNLCDCGRVCYGYTDKAYSYLYRTSNTTCMRQFWCEHEDLSRENNGLTNMERDIANKWRKRGYT